MNHATTFDPLYSLHVAERRESRHEVKHPEVAIDPGASNARRVVNLYARRLNTGRNRQHHRAPNLR
jgi:hypothetical protein